MKIQSLSLALISGSNYECSTRPSKHLKQFDKLLFADQLDPINMIVIFDELNHGLVSG